MIDEGAFRAERAAVLSGAKLLYWSRWFQDFRHYPREPTNETRRSARYCLIAMDAVYEMPNMPERNHTSAQIFDMALVRFNATMREAVKR